MQDQSRGRGWGIRSYVRLGDVGRVSDLYLKRRFCQFRPRKSLTRFTISKPLFWPLYETMPRSLLCPVFVCLLAFVHFWFLSLPAKRCPNQMAVCVISRVTTGLTHVFTWERFSFRHRFSVITTHWQRRFSAIITLWHHRFSVIITHWHHRFNVIITHWHRLQSGILLLHVFSVAFCLNLFVVF